MKCITMGGNSVTYLYDYGKVTKNEYLLFQDEVELVSDIQDFKNSIISPNSRLIAQNFLDTLTKIKERFPNVYFVSIPSSKVHNNNRIIDRIATNLNANSIHVLERAYDIEPAHISGHTPEHYIEFKDSLRINSIGNDEIVIIDDICTSGRTIDVCKEMLVASGKRIVDIVVVGKTISYTNLDIGTYSLLITDIVSKDEYCISLKFDNGRYFRVKDEKGFMYAFQHRQRISNFNYDIPQNVQELPEIKTVLVNVFKAKSSSDFKSVRIIYLQSIV